MNNRRLLNLILDNKDIGLNKIHAEHSDETVTLYIYGVIDSFFGINAFEFNKELEKIGAEKNIVLRINSPGGDVFEARAIMTALSNHPAKVTARIDGLAASAATLISLAADRIEISDGALYMIHYASSLAYGNSSELRKTADLLDKVDAILVDDYVKKTSKEPEAIKEWLAAETWFSAQQALDNGFVDAIIDSTSSPSAMPKAVFNLAAYLKGRDNGGASQKGEQIEFPDSVQAKQTTDQDDGPTLTAAFNRLLAQQEYYERT